MPPQDRRGRESNGPLRKVTDLTFLLRRPTGSSPPIELDYLCEAQASLLITGSDPWRWTAYCFVDTYFESKEKRESVDGYDEERDVDEDSGVLFEPDPLTAGEQDTNLPIKGSREYFLTVLLARTRIVKTEWQTLVQRLEDLISAYVRYPYNYAIQKWMPISPITCHIKQCTRLTKVLD